MRKLSILFLALLLAFSLVFVSCESNPNNQNTETGTETKTEATGKEFNDATAKAVVENNKDVVAEVQPYIETIEGIMKNPEGITSLVVKVKVEPKNSGDTFSFTTAENYKAYKSYLEKYNETAESHDKMDIPADSELVPKKYKYIDVTWNISKDGEELEINYKTDKKDYKVDDFHYGDDEDNPLGMDVQCFGYSSATDTGTNYSSFINNFLEIAKVSPTLSGSVEVGVEGKTYVFSYSEALSSEGRSIILVDNISIKEGETTLVSFKCKSTLKFSDDFSFVEVADEDTGESSREVKGSMTLSFSDIELLLGDGTYSLTGSIDGTMDFTKMRAVVNCKLTEKIKNIEYIALDFSIDISADVKDKGTVDDILDCLKIYTFRVAGTEYSSESVKKYISALMNEKAAE